MNLENGEIIILDNKEYICVSTAEYKNELYACLMSNFKPVEIKFAKKIPDKNNIHLEIINDINQKETLLNLFATSIGE